MLRVTRSEDAHRFAPHLADDRDRSTADTKLPRNRLVLFHSTKVSNVIGILVKGLCVVPPEAPTTGYRFGKGIYFADAFDKAAQYAGGRNTYIVVMVTKMTWRESWILTWKT